MDLVEQHAVGHEGDAGVLRHLVGEAHLVPHEPAEGDVELVRDTLGDRACRDPARLRVRDALAAELEADLGQLRRLSRARRARHDHDLVGLERARDLVPRGADGQLRRVADDGDGRGHSLPSYPAGPGGGRAATAARGRWRLRPTR